MLDKDGIIQNTKYDKEVVVFMPLTPSYCLVIDYKLLDHDSKTNKAQKKIRYKKVDKTVASLINSYHGFHLSQNLFANNPTLAQEVCEFIKAKIQN